MRRTDPAIVDVAFRLALRRRLMLPLLQAPARCSYKYATEQEDGRMTCGHAVGVHMHHCLTCGVGPHRIRLHNAMVNKLAQ
eukprot:3315373-Karenia_brevis.AAC.1